MQKISTNTLITRKQVEIDGHPFTVRKFGAGEQLRLNQLIKESIVVEKKLDGLKDESEDIESVDKALDLAKQMMEIFLPLFDDGGDGSKSRKLVESLNQQEVQLLFKQIFDEPNAEETTEDPASKTDS